MLTPALSPRRATRTSRGLRGLLAASLLAVGLLPIAQPLEAKGCLEGSPALPAPPTLWDELVNPAIIQDATNYTGQQLPTSAYPITTWVDVENGYLFSSYFAGFQIWDARGPRADDPIEVATIDGWSGFPSNSPFLQWIPGGAEIREFVYGIDAPPGDDSIVALSAIAPVGFSIWDTSNKVNPKPLYQDGGDKFMHQVYAAEIDGRQYAFGADFAGAPGLHIYDMTSAKAFKNTNGCLEGSGCGVYEGVIEPGRPVRYVHGAEVEIAGSPRHFVIHSSGEVRSTGGFTVFDVTDPTSPSRVVTGIGSGRAFGVALWTRGTGAATRAYLAARTLDQLRVYDATDCLAAASCTEADLDLLSQTPIQMLLESANWLSVSYSESGDTPFLYLGNFDLCRQGNTAGKTEYLFDVSSPSFPRDISPTQTILTSGVPVDYWSWSYSDFTKGFSYMAPRGGKFNGPYFYRAASSIFDLHEWIGDDQALVVIGPENGFTEVDQVFTATVQGCVANPSGWVWSTDGGSLIDAVNGESSVATIRWSSVGTKTVSASNSNCPDAEVTAAQIAIASSAPVIGEISVEPTNPSACEYVLFGVEATGVEPLTYEWELLDGGVPVPGVTSISSLMAWTPLPDQTGQFVGRVTVSGLGPDAVAQQAVNVKAPQPLPATFQPSADPSPDLGVRFHAGVPEATEWRWDFDDDGNPATREWEPWTNDRNHPTRGADPIHVYATPGPRTVYVRLRSCDGFARNSEPLSITVQSGIPLEADFEVQCGVGGLCSFPELRPVAFTDRSSGAELWDYDWDGDGIFEEQGLTSPKTRHTYTTTGTFTPRLRVRRGSDQDTDVHPFSILIFENDQPAGVLVTGPTSGSTHSPYAFSAEGINCAPGADGWTWAVDGGTVQGPSDAATVVVSWASSGSRSLSASHPACGAVQGTFQISLTTSGATGGLIADFVHGPAAPGDGTLILELDASPSSGGPTTYLWNLPGGVTKVGRTITHTFPSTGNFNVTLEVSKPGCGGRCTAQVVKTLSVFPGAP